MTRAFTSQADLDQWKAEREELENSIGQIEGHAHTVLRALKCPIDPVAIYAILRGETRRPWPAKTAARDKQRAFYAMRVLLMLQETRRYLGPAHENAPMAAHAALRAGFFANAIDAAFGAKMRERKRILGRKGGQAKARHVQTRDKAKDTALLRHAAAWLNSVEEILDKHGKPYATAAAYASARTNRPLRTVQARLKDLRFTV